MTEEKFPHKGEEDPLFLKVKSTDTVLIAEDKICKVLSYVGGTKDQLVSTFF
tara:strand:+ start:48 stop:203 length:156 start_codon:yes stop_codon:yes gene_type:complete